jgi:hypothetical protein
MTYNNNNDKKWDANHYFSTSNMNLMASTILVGQSGGINE